MRKNNIKKKIDKPDTAMKTFWRNNEPLQCRSVQWQAGY